MANRYSNPTLIIKRLSDAITTHTIANTIFSPVGTEQLNRVGSGSFSISTHDPAYATIVSNLGQIAYVYQTDSVFGSAYICSFIMQKVTTKTTKGGAIATISGSDIMHQLSFDQAQNDAIDNGSGGLDTSDVTNIMAYAPSGWTRTGASGTANGTYHASRGDSVLQLLQNTAKQSGEIFRMNTVIEPTKVVNWLASADSSGVTLRMPNSPSDYDGSTTVGIIDNLTESLDFTQTVTRIRPYGAGTDSSRLDITDIDAGDTGGDPTGYVTTFPSNLIVNSTLESSLGYEIFRDVDFPWIRADDVSDATQSESAAVALWNEAVTYLQERDTSRKFYNVTAYIPANIRTGQTITVVYEEYQGANNTGTKIIDINGTFTIHDVSHSLDGAGQRVTKLKLGDSLIAQPVGADVLIKALQKNQASTRKTPPEGGISNVPTTRALSTTNPLKIDNLNTANLSSDRTLSLSGIGGYSANRVIGSNAAANTLEYKTIAAGANVTVNHSSGQIAIAADVATSDLHDAVTFGTNVNNFLSLTGQIISLDSQAANTFWAGPTSGGAADPTFRAPVFADIPTDSDPTGEAILASNSNGRLGLEGLGIGAPAGTDNLTLANGVWVGGGAAEPRFIIDTSNNDITLQGGDLHFHDGSEDKVKIRVSGNGVDTEADIWMHNRGAVAAEGHMAIFIDADDSTTDSTFSVYRNAENYTDGEQIFRLTEGGFAGLGVNPAPTNANMTVGLTIDQGANDDEVLAFKSSDVATGVTGEAETDVFGKVEKVFSTSGGLQITGITEGTGALIMRGVATSANTTKSTSGAAAVEVRAYLKSGSSAGSMSSNGNLFAIRNNTLTKWIVDAEGDVFRDGSDNTFDGWDDAKLAYALNKFMNAQRAGDWEYADPSYTEQTLVDAGLIVKDGNGGYMLNESAMTRLAVGGLPQLYTHIMKTDEREQETRQSAQLNSTTLDTVDNRLAAIETFIATLGFTP